MDCETASLKGHLEHQLGHLGVRPVGVLQLGECGLQLQVVVAEIAAETQCIGVYALHEAVGVGCKFGS